MAEGERTKPDKAPCPDDTPATAVESFFMEFPFAMIRVATNVLKKKYPKPGKESK